MAEVGCRFASSDKNLGEEPEAKEGNESVVVEDKGRPTSF